MIGGGPMILIISDPAEDAHVGFVEEELRVRGAEYVIFNPGDYPVRSSITVSQHDTGAPVMTLSGSGTTVDLGDVTGAWIRRPGKPSVTPDMDPAVAEWADMECRHVVRGLYEHIPHARWISQPSAIERANTKPWQLRIARELGFSVPPYVLTTDPDAARAFIRRHDHAVIAKSLARPFLVWPQEAEAQVMYTRLLDREAEAELAHVRNAPTFFQKYIVKEADLRVIVIGEEVFAVEIASGQNANTAVDFRVIDPFDLPHRVVTLSPQLNDACVALTKRLGLAFGAIDIVRDADGGHHFLEINPNGQWMWLEWMTGVPLRRAICDFLCRRPAHVHG